MIFFELPTLQNYISYNNFLNMYSKGYENCCTLKVQVLLDNMKKNENFVCKWMTKNAMSMLPKNASLGPLGVKQYGRQPIIQMCSEHLRPEGRVLKCSHVG